MRGDKGERTNLRVKPSPLSRSVARQAEGCGQVWLGGGKGLARQRAQPWQARSLQHLADPSRGPTIVGPTMAVHCRPDPGSGGTGGEGRNRIQKEPERG